MNILNVAQLDETLNIYAARAIYPTAAQWVRTVARKHFMNGLTPQEVNQNFVLYGVSKDPLLPPLDAQPEWVHAALKRGDPVHYFQKLKSESRATWQALLQGVLWFNSFKPKDPRLRDTRISRFSFKVVVDASSLWSTDINTNIWNYIKDNAPVMADYGNYRVVRLVSRIQFEREGQLMRHCVGNGGYYSNSEANRRSYYSLRDAHNEPRATMEVEHSKPYSVVQCKARSNGRPSDVERAVIKRFIKEKGWSVDGDANNCS